MESKNYKFINWFVCFSGFCLPTANAQPILNDVKEELLKTHFLPVIVKLRGKMETVFSAEEILKKEYPMGGNEMEEAEFAILEVRGQLQHFSHCVFY